MSSEWNREEKLKKSVEEFKKTIVKGPFKKYIYPKKTELPDNKILFCADALYQGYLDACRTFHGQEKISNIDNMTEKDNNKLWEIATDIQKYLVEGKSECFPEKHQIWCDSFMEYQGMKYGQAQKIVNMSFKYMYCFFYGKEQFDDYLKKFDKCHMPLDSFSLEWLTRCSKKDKSFQIKANAWSKLNLEEYQLCCNQINILLEKTNISPLQLDFYVWSKMQVILSAEAFMKTLKRETEDDTNEKIEGDELEALDRTLIEKLEEIQKIVNDEISGLKKVD